MSKKLNIKAKKQIDDKLLQLFIKDFQSFRIIEGQRFKEFVKALNLTSCLQDFSFQELRYQLFMKNIISSLKN